MSKFLNILIRMRLATGLSESGRLAVVRCRGRWGLMAARGEGHSLLTTLNIVHVLQKKQVNLCLDKTILSIWYIYIIQQIHVYNSIQFLHLFSHKLSDQIYLAHTYSYYYATWKNTIFSSTFPFYHIHVYSISIIIIIM